MVPVGVFAGGVVGALGVVSAPASLAAQETRLLLISDDGTRDAVRRFLDAARVRGTPTEPLVSRALEGVAFRATPKEIERALAALEKRLKKSRELLGANSTVDELAAGADALAHGAPESALRDMRRIAPGRRLTVELGVLTELLAKDIAPKTAATMVLRLMARGASGTQLTELNAAVQKDVALGVKPVSALELRGRGVMSLLPPAGSVVTAQKR
ncbi:MAG: hypothetical protein FJ202_00455 [Gemmatimonadetes bacterium]|nr:hypothetical protein [Gemmatimonadota bacterium]MBM4438346.1 hypothetical protein [Actinomycetota bacterium]